MNAYSVERVREIAAGMLARYSTAKVAGEMAHFHAMDFPAGSAERSYWYRVGAEIRDQARWGAPKDGAR